MMPEQSENKFAEILRVAVAVSTRLQRWATEGQDQSMILADEATEEIASFWREADRLFAEVWIPARLAAPVAALQWGRFAADSSRRDDLAGALRLFSELMYTAPEIVPDYAIPVLLSDSEYEDEPLQWAKETTEMLQEVEREYDSLTLNRAIRLLQLAAANLPPEERRNRCQVWNNLGYALRMRFDRENQAEDLDEAAAAGHEALELLAHGDPMEARFVSNLAATLTRRFAARKDTADLDSAVDLLRRAVASSRDGAAPERSRRLDLAKALSTRYQATGTPGDLSEIIDVLKLIKNADVVDPSPPGDLLAIARALRSRFGLSGETADLDELIRVAETALATDPTGRMSEPLHVPRDKWIRIEEAAVAGGESSPAWISFHDGGRHEVLIASPISEGDERLLEWYFEEYLETPFLNWDRAELAKRTARVYGERLFEQVFAGDARSGYEAGRATAFDGYRLEIVGSAKFQRLHWEALIDSEAAQPLALLLPIVRRPAHPGPETVDADAAEAANVLLVTARPDGVDDVAGFRTISQPLYEELSLANTGVTIEFARPGTWQSLLDHLSARGHGHYLAVHFDVHGINASFAELVQASIDGRITMAPGLTPFPGRRAFLSFETAETGVSEQVPADQIADALTAHGVQIAVLNACQSAKSPTTESSLAAALVEAGIPTAVGMAYSVTVTGARLSMPAVYGALARGQDMASAMQTARRRLFEDDRRKAFFGQSVELADWLLPVLVGREDVRLVRPGAQTRGTGRPTPPPDLDFVGRDLDVQAIERRLLVDSDRNLLLVRGMAGIGKSTLLRHLGWWWQQTGLVEKTFEFGYDKQAWTAVQLLRTVAADYIDGEELAAFDADQFAGQIAWVLDKLREHRALVVIDNAESITGDARTVPHALDEGERAQLTKVIAGLRGGRTLVIIGSREPEDWLAPSTFTDNVHALKQLDRQAAADLAQRIMVTNGVHDRLTRAADWEGTMELIEYLDGNPLAMHALLPRLVGNTPQGLIAAMREPDPAAEWLGLAGRSIRLSIDRLEPSLRRALLVFTPFVSLLPTSQLDNLATFLKQQPAFADAEPVDLEGAVHEATRMGLLRELDSGIDTGYSTIMPLVPPVLQEVAKEDLELWTAAHEMHYTFYFHYASTVLSMVDGADEKKRFVGKGLVAQEHNNFDAALRYALSRGHRLLYLCVALDVYYQDADRSHLRQRLFAEVLTDVFSAERPDAALLYSRAAVAAADSNDPEAFEQYRRKALESAADAGDEKLRSWVRVTLAGALTKWDRFDDAADELVAGTRSADRDSTAEELLLAEIAESRGDAEKAEAHYLRLLAILRERGDRFRTAVVQEALGSLRAKQRDHAGAEQALSAALAGYIEVHDQSAVARAMHMLGRVMEELDRDDEAEDYYRRSLEIYGQQNDETGAAYTHHMLGKLLQKNNRLDGADQHYRKAQTGYAAAGERGNVANAQIHRGMLAIRRGQYDAAKPLLESAREALIGLEQRAEQNPHDRRFERDRTTMGSAYFQLGLVAQSRQDFPEAKTQFLRALEIAESVADENLIRACCGKLGEVTSTLDQYDESEFYNRRAMAGAGPRDLAVGYHNLGQIARKQGRYGDARRLLDQSAEIMRQLGDRLGYAHVSLQIGITALAQKDFGPAAIALLTTAVYGFLRDRDWPKEAVEALRTLRAAPGGDDALTAAMAPLPPEVARALRAELIADQSSA